MFAKVNEIFSKPSPNDKVLQRLILRAYQIFFRGCTLVAHTERNFIHENKEFYFSLRLKHGPMNALDK